MKRNNVARVALGIVRKFAPKVNRVSDADKDLAISVTEKDYRTGRKKDHGECALAMAAKRERNVTSVIISASTAYLIKGDHAIRYKLPEAIRKEVVSFDRGSEFGTGDYVMKAIPKSARLGTQRGKSTQSEVGSHTGNLAKRFIHHTANIREDLKARA